MDFCFFFRSPALLSLFFFLRRGPLFFPMYTDSQDLNMDPLPFFLAFAGQMSCCRGFFWTTGSRPPPPHLLFSPSPFFSFSVADEVTTDPGNASCRFFPAGEVWGCLLGLTGKPSPRSILGEDGKGRPEGTQPVFPHLRRVSK